MMQFSSSVLAVELIHRHACLSSVTLTHILIPAPHSQIRTLLHSSSVLPFSPEAKNGCRFYLSSIMFYIKIIPNPLVQRWLDGLQIVTWFLCSCQTSRHWGRDPVPQINNCVLYTDTLFSFISSVLSDYKSLHLLLPSFSLSLYFWHTSWVWVCHSLPHIPTWPVAARLSLPGSVIIQQLQSREGEGWGWGCAQQKGLRQLKRVMQQQYGCLHRQPTAILLLVMHTHGMIIFLFISPQFFLCGLMISGIE